MLLEQADSRAERMSWSISQSSRCLDRSMLLKMTFRDKSVCNTSAPQEEAATVDQYWGFCQPLTDMPWLKLQAYNCQRSQNREREISHCVRQGSMWPRWCTTHAGYHSQIDSTLMLQQNSQQHRQKSAVLFKEKRNKTKTNEMRQNKINSQLAIWNIWSWPHLWHY